MLLVAACTTSGRSAPARHPAGPARAEVDARPATDAATVRVLPAAYQLPAGVSRAVVLPHGPDLLILGGLSQRSAASSTVRLLNPVTGNTTVVGRLAAARPGAAGAILNGGGFLFGGGDQAAPGQQTPGQQTTVQQIGARGTSTVAGRLPAPRSGLATVTIGGTAYLLGGAAGTGAAADVLATTDGRHFRAVARLPVPVRDPAVAALGQQIWVFGGQAAAGPTSDIQRVTVPAAGRAGTAHAAIAGQLPRPVTGAAAFALGGTVFIAGGQVSQPHANPATAITGQLLSYQPGRAGVTVAGQLPVPVENAGVAVTGGTAFLVGGNDGVRPVPTVTLIQLAPDPPAGQTAGTPWLGPPLSGSHLMPGSNPAALPSDVLIADNMNNRLLIVDPQGRIRWNFPQPGDLAQGQTFLVPDDAFFSPDGKQIVATEEDDSGHQRHRHRHPPDRLAVRRTRGSPGPATTTCPTLTTR